MHKINDNTETGNHLDQEVKELTRQSERQLYHIQKLTKIGLSLSSMSNLERIFALVIDEAMSYSDADAATIYRVSPDKQYLDFVLISNKSLNLQLVGGHDKLSWPSIPLYDTQGKPLLTHIAANVYHKKRLLAFKDVYETTEFDISGTREIDTANGYRSRSMLTLPLKNHENEVLGVLQVINAMNNNGNVIPFTREHTLMLKSLASQAAIAMTNRQLINDLESLLLEFMQSIAKGIERKSKFSSNHITRVAVLADLIAHKINSDSRGIYSNIHFGPSELKELSMAGLMHDVGKIVTPDHVMDKATKLEAVFDRINLVSLRYELLKRTLTLFETEQGGKALQKLSVVWYPEQPSAGLSELFNRLDEDLEFIRKTNQGSESSTPRSLERIKRISKMRLTYQGTELFLLTGEETEHLLIKRGTLSDDEKKAMDEHVVATWEMLSQLTFPSKFRNVALYAATHHERMNGKGYPFGLSASQLPLQSRILAVADRLEALTAADRPYKKQLRLSEALTILAGSVRDGEIDSGLFDFILDSGLYQQYSQTYMKPEYIDVVDIAAIKTIYHSGVKH